VTGISTIGEDRDPEAAAACKLNWGNEGLNTLGWIHKASGSSESAKGRPSVTGFRAGRGRGLITIFKALNFAEGWAEA